MCIISTCVYVYLSYLCIYIYTSIRCLIICIYIIRHIHKPELEGHLIGDKHMKKLKAEAAGVHVVQTFSVFINICIYMYIYIHITSSCVCKVWLHPTRQVALYSMFSLINGFRSAAQLAWVAVWNQAAQGLSLTTCIYVRYNCIYM